MSKKAPNKVRNKSYVTAALVLLVPLYLFTPIFAVQFLCLFLLFVVLGSRLYSEYLVHKLRLVRLDSELRTFKQQWVQVELRVENQGLLPVFLLALRDDTGMLPVSEGNKMLCSLPGSSKCAFIWRGYCSDRGLFVLGPAGLQGSDPLGLFPFVLPFQEKTRLFVYPSPRSVMLTLRDGTSLGRLLSQNILDEDLSRPRSLHPYQIGDEPRRINWKASVRTPSTFGLNLMVNEYEATVSYPMSVFLNFDISAYAGKKSVNLMERAIEVAAALCMFFAQKQQDIGLMLFSREKVVLIEPSRYALIPILESLALAEHGSRDGSPVADCAGALLGRLRHLRSGTKIFYVGPLLSDEAYLRLGILQRFHVNIEYFITDERLAPPITPGKARQYQVREFGNEIL